MNLEETPASARAWSHSEARVLAAARCATCLGLGVQFGRGGPTIHPCHCVLRMIWRLCYQRFRTLTERQHRSHSPLSLEGPRVLFSLKNEEYCADFCNVAKRALGEDTLAHKLFSWHYLLGAEWSQCCQKLGMNRGEFFHEVYRVQQRLGAAFRDTAPFALFPIAEYFTPRKRVRYRN